MKQKIKKEKTFITTIHLGLREQYTEIIHSFEDVEAVCQSYVDDIGQCVNVTKCNFIYTKGSEPGVRIEFIQYPRFPEPEDDILAKAIELATVLMYKFNQLRVTVVSPKDTYMISNKELINKLNLEI